MTDKKFFADVMKSKRFGGLRSIPYFTLCLGILMIAYSFYILDNRENELIYDGNFELTEEFERGVFYFGTGVYLSLFSLGVIVLIKMREGKNTWKLYGYALASLLLIIGIARGLEQMQEVEGDGTVAMVLAFLSWDGIFPFFLFMVIIVRYGGDYEKISSRFAAFEFQGSIKEKQIDDTTVILLYLLSFFIPLAGFIVGAIYASRDEEHYKDVGKNCLICSTLNVVLSFIVIMSII